MYANEARKTDSLALHHDLLVEMGRVELAMDNLSLQASEEEAALRKQRLESRMAKLQEAVRRLSV